MKLIESGIRKQQKRASWPTLKKFNFVSNYTPTPTTPPPPVIHPRIVLTSLFDLVLILKREKSYHNSFISFFFTKYKYPQLTSAREYLEYLSCLYNS